MKKKKKTSNKSSKTTNKSLDKEELEKLKKQYKEGKLKFDSKDVAQAMIDDGINLKD